MELPWEKLQLLGADLRSSLMSSEELEGDAIIHVALETVPLVRPRPIRTNRIIATRQILQATFTLTLILTLA